MARPLLPVLLYLGRRHFSRQLVAAQTNFLTRFYSASSPLSRPAVLPNIELCPSPTCECAPTPSFPEGFEIDHKANLSGAISQYAEHVLVCTGKSDWASKIEDEHSGDNLAADLKELLGRGGVYNDPFHNISVLNSSFPSTLVPKVVSPGLETTSVYLLPSFKYVPWLPRVSFEAVQTLVKGFLLPKKLHKAHDGLSPTHKDRLKRDEAFQSLVPGVQNVKDVLVLLCGHGGRDLRCGVAGSLLKQEFEKKLESLGSRVLMDPVEVDTESDLEAAQKMEEIPLVVNTVDIKKSKFTSRVGLVSHIGGHKFAGNAILYLPPQAKTGDGTPHPLAGTGIWYGRVEPRHVEGIVRETILKGNVIKELFRGAINQQRDIISF